jgi:hypothetical protein
MRTLLLCLAMVFGLAVPTARADDTARADLLALWQKMFATRDLAFSAEIVSIDKKGRETRSQMRTNWPNRFHMKSADSEFIIIGDGTWMKIEGQGWMKFPMSMKKVIDAYTPEVMKASMDGTTNVRYLRDETVEGKDCKVFAYDFDVKVMGFRSRGSSTVFLDKDSGYPLRAETEGEAMGQRSKTIVTYDYDPNIRVAAPN